MSKKNVLVTGCFGKIGYSVCKKLLENGYNVFGIDIKSGKLNLKALKIYGSNFKYYKFNLQYQNISKLANIVKKNNINNFVHCSYPKLKIYNEEINLNKNLFFENIEKQLLIPLNLSLNLINIFKKNRIGKIVLLSSIQGISSPKFEHYIGTKMKSPLDYTIIKSSIISITKYLAKKYGKYNININCVSPGGILNNQNKKFLRKYKSSCLTKGMLLGSDISGSILFLLSEDSNYINGQNIIIDDGWSL